MNSATPFLASLSQTGGRVIAHIRNNEECSDFVIALRRGNLAVARLTCSAAQSDHTALATMLAEGPFVWAGLVYDTLEHPVADGPIESFHVSELDRLVGRLLALQETYREAV